MTFESCEDLLLRITELKSALIYMERTLLETHFESCIIPHLKAPAEIVLSVHNLRLSLTDFIHQPFLLPLSHKEEVLVNQFSTLFLARVEHV
jgi:hypothetical protein